MPILDNKMEIWESVRTVPSEVKSQIRGGRLKGMTDIKPQWRLQKLTETFGPCGFGWKYVTVDRWRESLDANTEVSVHVIINLFVKIDDKWSDGIEGQGGSMLLAREKAGLHHSDEAYKMATTDAISVACKQLGIGADVYMGYSVSKYAGSRAPETFDELKGAKNLDELVAIWKVIYPKVSHDTVALREASKVKDEVKARLSNVK